MLEGKITAVQTSAGMGARLRPLNLYSPTSMMPKGLMRIMGIPIAELQIQEFKDAGILDVYIITQYLENRVHLSDRFGDGNRFGLRIHYSDPTDDKTNNGSGDAILTNIEKNYLNGDSIWLPNDNLFEFDFQKIIKEHRDLGAVVSIMTVSMPPRDTIKNYGLVSTDPDYRVTRLVEKPKDELQVMEALGVSNPEELNSMRVPVNTAGYVLNNDELAKIAKEQWVIKGRKKSSGNFDMAGSLLRGLIEKKYPIYIIPIDAWGDFGTITYYLDTFPDALTGKFPSIYKVLERTDYEHYQKENVWVHRDSLDRINEEGKTLRERIAAGKLKIGPHVFIGRKSVIEDETEIRYSNLEKYATVRKGAKLDHVYLSPFCEIGRYADLRECALGLQVTVDSSKDNPTHIDGRSVLGPKIFVPKGTKLYEATIFPGYLFEKKGETYTHKRIDPSPEQIKKILEEYK